ncbi:MAG: hypothetical protein DRG69_09165, partial [Deltaproteobacteria bacterium]
MAKFPFKSLRDWVQYLENCGELVRNSEEVDTRGDIAAISREIALSEGPAIIHENIRGYLGWKVFTDGLATRRRLLLALNLPSENATRIACERLEGDPIAPITIEKSDAPCKEVALSEKDIDLRKFPLCFTGE